MLGRNRGAGEDREYDYLQYAAMTVGSTPTSGGQTANDPSGWSTDTLKDYFERLVHDADRRYEQRFVAQEKAVEAALEASALATSKAEQDNQRWRDAANEWRDAMNDREVRFMPRNEAAAELGNFAKQLEEHVKARAFLIDSLQKQISELQTWRASTEGKSTGLSAGWGYLVGAIGLAATVIAIILALAP